MLARMHLTLACVACRYDLLVAIQTREMLAKMAAARSKALAELEEGERDEEDA
jgi:hypothetical protein